MKLHELEVPAEANIHTHGGSVMDGKALIL